jgi:beta-phosphoglucomutase-like phosphatase (HAD superfamily)
MRDLQLVIFDCDGVLVDSETISNDVLTRALTAEGLPTTLAEARRDYQGLLLADVVSQAQACSSARWSAAQEVPPPEHHATLSSDRSG